MNSITRPTAYAACAIATVAIAAPWLNPFASGPSPPLQQWLFTGLCAAVLLLLQARRLLEGGELARAAAAGWLLAALLSSVIGLVQYFGVSAEFAPLMNVTPPGEAFANLRQRNQFATLTNIGLAVLLWWVAQRPTAQEKSSPLRLPLALAWFMAALLALGNATTSSRTGAAQLLALALCLGVWSLFDKKVPGSAAPRRAAQLLAFALLIYGVAALWLLPRLAGLDAATQGAMAHFVAGNSDCGGRRTLWSNVLYLIAQKPWLGWGWGELGYAHYITLYPGKRFCDILDNAHNLPLQLALELGLPATLTLCAGALALVLRERPWREREPARRMAWAVLAVILLHSMVEYPLWYGPFLLAAMLCLVLLVPPQVGAWAASMGTAARRARLGAGAAALMLLALVGYTAWDYERISQIFLASSQRLPAYKEDTLIKAQRSLLFARVVRYAELSTTPVTRSNAEKMRAMATSLLHFSAEARVIEKLIEADVQLGLDDEALFHMQRFRAAFPDEYAHWRQGRASD